MWPAATSTAHRVTVLGYWTLSHLQCRELFGFTQGFHFAHLRHLTQDERALWRHVILRCTWTNMVRIEKLSLTPAPHGYVAINNGAPSLWPTDNTVHLEGLFDIHNGLIGCLTANTQRLWISDEHRGKLMNKWEAQLCIEKDQDFMKCTKCASWVIYWATCCLTILRKWMWIFCSETANSILCVHLRKIPAHLWRCDKVPDTLKQSLRRWNYREVLSD